MRRPVSAPRRPGFAAAVVVLSALAPPGRARSAPAPGGGDVRLASVLVRSRAGLGRPFRLLYLGDSHVAGGAFPGAVDALLEETLGADVASRRHAVVGARADFLVRDGGGVLEGLLRRAAPDLVLVAYGTNEARDPDFEPGAYRATVEAIVSRLRAGTGGAAVALVGPPEQERRGNGGSFRPVPALASVSAVQAAAAEATGAVFVDLSVEMGGGAGFRRWTEEVPPLVAEDRVHYTPAGYERLARLLVARLIADANRELGSPSSAAGRGGEAAHFRLPPPRALVATSGRTAGERRPPHAAPGADDLRAYRRPDGRLVLTNLPSPLPEPVLSRGEPR